MIGYGAWMVLVTALIGAAVLLGDLIDPRPLLSTAFVLSIMVSRELSSG